MNDALPLMRCDLHVHSIHSGPATLPALRWLVNECYSSPKAVYERARQRGMNLVTLTDHDTIAGALELAGRPDTFVSEEVTVLLEDRRELHLGVYDITEAQHQRIQERRRDPEALLAFLAEERIPACLNHPFSALTGHREPADLQLGFGRLRLVEGRNGMMSKASNSFASRAARTTGRELCGGSDAHTLASVARAFTCVVGRSREEFLAGLRAGMTLPAGHSGSYARLASDLLRILSSAYLHQAAAASRGGAEAGRFVLMLGLLPLAFLVPFFGAGVYLHEQFFARREFGRFALSPMPSWPARLPAAVGSEMAG